MKVSDVRQRHLVLMHKSSRAIAHLAKTLTQEEAQSWRDGPEGWTILEILCHLRDFNDFFLHRAQLMRDHEHPDLPAYDHEALAMERAYNQQNLGEVIQAFRASRRAMFHFFRQLSDAEWERTGHHPERGHFSMTDAVIQVGHHDNDHLEQMTRVILEARLGPTSTDSAPSSDLNDED